MSRVKTGTSIACDYKTNDIYYSALTGILPQLGCRDDEQNTVLKEFLAILRSQPMPSLNQITFDAYKEHKSKSNAGMFAKLVIPICHDLHISESEQASVASLIKLGSLITGLANDYESFYRDFEEHATSGSLDVIPNAMAVLMANYDYTEEEANNILRREILSLERQFLTNYDDWKASPAFKSADLRAYMALWVTSVGGTCYAQAISPRYHGLKLKTTAEDRAQLLMPARIDDIEDDSMLRRGKLAVYVVFGKAQTVNSATYLYAKATRDLDQLQQDACKAAFLDELETLALGQALDLHWKFQKTCPTTGEYLTMVDNKTGGLFRMTLRLLEIESKAEPCPDLMQLITLMGRYYQIRDDYLNLTSDEYTGTKGYCEDLSEGKLSFPLIHALQNSPEADMLRGLLFHRENGHELSLDMKSYIVAEMRKVGSLAHARETALQLFDAMMGTLERVEATLGPNKRLKALLLWLKL
ncbi:FAD binding domain family protein [Aspergillus niger]|uniref:FAD binding domain family protein n=1 Tax=Aspergillus niger TaxID=5061 RepID=A0A505IF46_ASPNG|nr:FAD binding domain family protein [Aspergillus niger]